MESVGTMEGAKSGESEETGVESVETGVGTAGIGAGLTEGGFKTAEE